MGVQITSSTGFGMYSGCTGSYEYVDLEGLDLQHHHFALSRGTWIFFHPGGFSLRFQKVACPKLAIFPSLCLSDKPFEHDPSVILEPKMQFNCKTLQGGPPTIVIYWSYGAPISRVKQPQPYLLI